MSCSQQSERSLSVGLAVWALCHDMKGSMYLLVSPQVVFTRGGQGEAVNKQRIAKVGGGTYPEYIRIRYSYIEYIQYKHALAVCCNRV
jgi:hypothetical protein